MQFFLPAQSLNSGRSPPALSPPPTASPSLCLAQSQPATPRQPHPRSVAARYSAGPISDSVALAQSRAESESILYSRFNTPWNLDWWLVFKVHSCIVWSKHSFRGRALQIDQQRLSFSVKKRRICRAATAGASLSQDAISNKPLKGSLKQQSKYQPPTRNLPISLGLGVKEDEAECYNVYGLVEELLAMSEDERIKEDNKTKEPSSGVYLLVVYFMKQTVGNACETTALLHVVIISLQR
nr:ubiquitin carboxyl-terminal hydrolase 3-like isoform X2 [Ipomoea batatas]